MVVDEELTWRPSERYLGRTRLRATCELLGVSDYRDFCALSVAEPERFWSATLDELGYRWTQPFSQFADLSAGPAHPRWFVGGRTNVVDNAVSRWARSERAHEIAIIDVPESGEERRISFAALEGEVAVTAAALTKLGVAFGDPVALVLPFTAQSAVILLGLAAVGAVAVPLFAGYGTDALADRMRSAAVRFVIVADTITRRGTARSMRTVVDQALSGWAETRPKVIVVGATNSAGIPTDLHWDDAVADVSSASLLPVQMDPNDDLVIAFSSGTAGTPKGVRHSHAGLPLKVAQEMAQIMDIGPGSTLLRITDLGWIGGVYTIFSGLMTGAAVVLYSGVPTWPSAERIWSLVGSHRATHLAISPTLARQLRRAGSTPTSDEIAALTMTTSVGEPWDRGTYEWYWSAVGNRTLPIVNHSGGTEVGNLLCSTPTLPISFGRFNSAVPGIAAAVYSDDGNVITDGVGELVVTRPFVGMTTGLVGGDEAYLDTYWRRFAGVWHQSDRAVKHADGSWELTGRSDDRLKVSGRGVAPSDIEAVALASGDVLEAVAIGVPDEITGTRIVLFVVRDADRVRLDLADRLRAKVRTSLGSAMVPAEIHVVDDLPRTPNGKIARRLVADDYAAGLISSEFTERSHGSLGRKAL